MAVPKPPAGPTAGKTAGMAGLYGGLGPTGYINQQYAPIAAQLAQQQQARVSTLNSLIQSILANLHQPQPDVYGAAAQDQTSAANAAAATLQRVNPNAATQSMLQAIGAPGSQQAQVGQQNANTFTGGAALDQYVGGALPAGVFAQDQAARGTYLNSLPALVGLAATQGIGRLGLLASQENANLASQKASAQQNAIATLADYTVKNQSNKITQASVLGNLLGYIPKGALGNKQPIGTLAGQRVKQGNARVQQGQQRIGIEQKNANTSAARAADASARGWASIGIRQRAAQAKAQADEKKLKSGGFTPSQVQRFKGTALTLAQNVYDGFTDSKNIVHPKLTYQQAVLEGRKEGLPVSIIMASLNQFYKPGERGRPFKPLVLSPGAYKTAPTPGTVKSLKKVGGAFGG